jgi:uncharacterized alpha-E superfamily protein
MFNLQCSVLVIETMLSRVADNLYWMSRYLQRAEHTARLLDVNVVLVLDQAPGMADDRWDRLFRSLAVTPPPTLDARTAIAALTFDREARQSIMGSVDIARTNARQVRAEISSEMWEQINLLYLQLSRTTIDDVWNAEPHTFFRSVKEGVQLVHGITESTMRQGQGWHFMQLGRFIDRAAATARLVDVHWSAWEAADQNTGATYLDWVGLLKSCTAFEAYCQEYTADLQEQRIAEFLLLDREFPHSVRYAVGRMHAALHAVVESAGGRRSAEAERLAGRLRALLDYATIDEILASGMHPYLTEVRELCYQIHECLRQTYFAPPLEAVLEG